MFCSTKPRPQVRRFRRFASGLCSALCLLVLLFFVGRAEAQDFAAAGQHFAAAQDAFTQGQYKRAAEEYQAAYDITKDGALLFNIGESWQRAGDAQKALIAYREYLKDQPGGSERPEVEKRVQSLEAAGATTAPTENGAPPTQTQPTTPDKPGTLTPSGPVATEKNPKVVPIVPGGPLPPPSRLRTAAWVCIAAAVALATAGAILGLGAQNRSDELQRRTTVLVNNQPPTYDDNQREAYESLVSEGKAYNSASIALLSVAGAAAVTGGALFIVDRVKHPPEQNRIAQTLEPSLRIGAGQATLGLGGRF